MSNPQESSDFSDVFVSYRRTNVEFVKDLVRALREVGKEVWIDWEDIPPGSTGFADDIKRGLEGSDAFIAVLSPDYLQSTYCIDLELGYALELNKKIIPVVLHKFADKGPLPREVRDINWIYFTPHAGQVNEFESAFTKVLQAIDQDIEHARTHKRLALRALEWENNDKRSSFLLSGDEIQQAEEWITDAVGKTPQPTHLHQEYIKASRELANTRQRQLLFGVSGALIVSLALAVVAIFFGFQANLSANEAATSEANAVANAELAVNNESTAVFNAELAENNAATAESARMLSEQRGTQVAEQAQTAVFNADLAANNESTAVFNAELALDNAATAESARVLSEQRGTQVAEQAQTAVFNADLAANNESTAVFNAELALDNAATAESARVLSEQRGTQVAEQAQTAVFNADLAANNESTAVFNAELALDNAATAESARVLSEQRGTQVAEQARTAVFNAELAENNAATAVFNAELALDNAATAESARVLSEQRGTQVAEQARTAVFNAELAENNAATAVFNADLAANNESTAVFNADLAENNAATAESARVLSEQRGTQVAEQAQTAIFNAELAENNESTAVFNADLASNNEATAVFNAALAFNNAATAESALATSEASELQARAQALAVFAQQALDVGEVELAMALAIESGSINPSLLLAQRVLSQAAPLGVRLSLSTYEDNVTFYDSPIASEQAPYGGIFAFSPDGTLLAFANPNHTIAVRDLESLERVTLLSGHRYRLTDLVFSPDGRYLISSSSNQPINSTAGELFVWEIDSGQLRELEGHVRGITDVALRPNTSTMISVSDDQTAILWDYETGFQVATYNDGYNNPLREASWSTDGESLYTFTDSGTYIRRIDENLQTEAFTARGDVRYLGLSPDVDYGYTGGNQPGSGNLTIWNAESVALLREFGIQQFDPFEEYVRFVEFVPSNANNLLVYLEQWQRISGSNLFYRGNKLAIWDSFSNSELSILDVDDDIRITALTYSEDGQFLLTADSDGLNNTLTLRSASNGRIIRQYFGHNTVIDQVAFSPDRSRAVSVDRSGVLLVWDIFVEDPSQIGEINLRIPEIFNENSRIPVITSRGDEIITVKGSFITSIETNTGRQLFSPQYVADTILDAAFDKNTNRALVRIDANRDYAPMMLWEVGEDRLATIGTLDSDSFSDGVFLPDGSGIILIGESRDDASIVARYDISNDPTEPEVVYRMNVSQQEASEELTQIRHVAINREGTRLVTVGTYTDRVNGPTEDEIIVLWDAITGDALSQFRVSTNGRITDVTFSPDGNSIITSLSAPSNLMIQWDVFTGEQQVQFTAHTDSVNRVIYNEAGDLILSGADDGTVILWDAASGQPIRNYIGHRVAVTSIDFYEERDAIISIGGDEILIREIETFNDTVEWVYANRFVPDFTCAQRLQYNIRPFCDLVVENAERTPSPAPIAIEPTPTAGELLPSATPTVQPTQTATPTLVPTLTLGATLTPSLTPSATSVIDTGYQITDDEPVSIRVRPSTTAITLPRTLQPGEFVELIEIQPDWLRIRLPDRTEGWVPLEAVNNGDI